MTPGPLAGLHVADLSVTLPGPYCSQLLRRLGASVTHLEPPELDPLRTLAPASFAALSAGKESVVVDLKSAQGLKNALAVLADSGIIIEGWRPGVADRLGVGYRAAAAQNAAVVYCSISGFGQTSELARKPGHDINYAAEAGALDLCSTDGLPMGDFAGAMSAALRIVAAVRQAELTGHGAYIDVSITGALADWVDAVGGADHPEFMEVYRLPHYGRFTMADGGVLTLGVARTEQQMWANLITALGCPEWAEAPTSERRDRSDEMRDFISRRIGSMTAREVVELLEPIDTCWAIARLPGDPPRVTGMLAVAGIDPDVSRRAVDERLPEAS
ncbi:MAG: CaiB/BaiF CoA-transferase family protein [Candidatus Dormibacteria bacterium]